MRSADSLSRAANRTSSDIAEATSKRTASRLEVLVRRVLVTLLLASLTISTAALISRDGITIVLGLLNVAAYSTLLITWRFSKGIAAGIASLVLLSSTVYAMAAGSGLHDVAIVVVPALLLVASLVVHRRLFAVVATITALSVVILGWLQLGGKVGLAAVRLNDPLDYVTVSVVICAVSALIFFIVENLARSLESAEANERAYREIFDASNEAIFIHNADTGHIVDVNATMLRMYGYRRDEVLALEVGDLSVADEGYDNDRAKLMIQEAVISGPLVFEWLAKHRNGSHFWVEVSLQQSNIGGEGRILAVARDIQERRKLAEQAKHAEKMQAVGQLAGGVAHDFNNQLAGIIGYAELMRIREGKNGPSAPYIDGILTSAGRAADLTAKLLAFARKGKQRSEPTNLHQIIREVVGLLERSIDRQVNIETNLGAGACTVLGDPSLLQNALLNLGLNARDALPHGGTIRFSTRDGTLDETETYCEGKRTLVIEVRDTGVGMDREVQDHLFEPFFTTKPAGTGMGLAAVYGTVHAHHGDITVDSVHNGGSSFQVFLPVAKEVPNEVGPVDVEQSVRLQLRVLFAEDEAAVADAIIQMLNELGCTVTHCEDGAVAARRFAEHPGDFDLALLDLNMPRMGGAATAEALRHIDPQFPIVIATGYDAHAIAPALAARESCVFMSKPFRLKELSNALTTLVRSRGER